MPPQPVRISGLQKDKKLVIQHISAEEVDVIEDENASPNPKSSVFNRIQSSTSKNFYQYSPYTKREDHRCSVFKRITDDPQSKPSVFARIGAGEKSSNSQL